MTTIQNIINKQWLRDKLNELHGDDTLEKILCSEDPLTDNYPVIVKQDETYWVVDDKGNLLTIQDYCHQHGLDLKYYIQQEFHIINLQGDNK